MPVLLATHAQINPIEAIILAIIQGVTELFPVSSVGHAVLVPTLLRWGIDQNSPTFLPFVVMLHVGTGAALLIFFWRDWRDLILAFFASVRERSLDGDENRKLIWLLIVGTIPAVIIGGLFEHFFKSAFSDAILACVLLVVNGAIMFAGERVRRGQTLVRDAAGNVIEEKGRPLASLSWTDALLVGVAEVGALFPGISRSGITIVAGLLLGLRHEAAARFSFLLATPVILGAAVLELPKLIKAPSALGISLVGGVAAAIAAYFSVRFLMKYFETGRLDPFAYYCVAAGIVGFVLLNLGL